MKNKHKKTRMYYLLVVLLLSRRIIVYSQTFELIVIGENNEKYQCITKAQNGNYLAAGITNSTFNNQNALFITYFDINGNILWNNLYIENQINNISHIVETSTGNFTIIGSNNQKLFFIQVNENGELIKAKKLELTNITEGKKIEPKPTFQVYGGLHSLGHSMLGNMIENEYTFPIILTINDDLDSLIRICKLFFDTTSSRGIKSIKAFDYKRVYKPTINNQYIFDGFLIAGAVYDSNHKSRSVLIKTDWDMNYKALIFDNENSNNPNGMFSIFSRDSANNNIFYIVGRYFELDTINAQEYAKLSLTKILSSSNNDFSLEWRYNFTFNNMLPFKINNLKIQQYLDTTLLVSGYILDTNLSTDIQAFLLNLDFNGNVIWSKVSNYDSVTVIYDLCTENNNHRYIFVGSRNNEDLNAVIFSANNNFIGFNNYNNLTYDVNIEYDTLMYFNSYLPFIADLSNLNFYRENSNLNSTLHCYQENFMEYNGNNIQNFKKVDNTLYTFETNLKTTVFFNPTIYIYNLLGKSIYTEQLNKVVSYSDVIDIIKLKLLGSGFYNVIIFSNNEYKNLKIIINNN